MAIRPNLPSAGAFRETFRLAVRNWGRGIRAALRGSGFSPARRADRLITAEFRKAAIVLSRTERKGSEAFASIARSPESEVETIAALVTALDGVPRFGRDVRLVLPDGDVLRVHLRLPAAPKARLREALRYELPRLSPLDADRLYYDFVAEAPASPGQTSAIALRILKRSSVDEAVALLHAAGIKIGAIGFAGDPRDADPRYFPIDRAAYGRALWQRWSIPGLLGAAVVLTLALLVAIYAGGSERLEALSPRIDTEQHRALIVTRLEQTLGSLSAQSRYLSDRKEAPMLVAILAGVTEVLPDGTWLTEFQLKNGKVHIQGFSHNASDLIGLIDKSPVFEGAAFEAPVTQSQSGNAEEFEISFALRGHK